MSKKRSPPTNSNEWIWNPKGFWKNVKTGATIAGLKNTLRHPCQLKHPLRELQAEMAHGRGVRAFLNGVGKAAGDLVDRYFDD